MMALTPLLLVLLAMIGPTSFGQSRSAPQGRGAPGNCVRDLGLLPVEITHRTLLRPRSGGTRTVAVNAREAFFYCSQAGKDFVVSIWPGGTAYRVSAASARQRSTMLPLQMSDARLDCIAGQLRREWARRSASADEYEQRMLQLARRYGITVVTLSDVSETAKHRDPAPCRN